MPAISNATVATGTGLSTAGNGGSKLTRLQNGALVSAVRSSTTSWRLLKSTDSGATWSQIVTVTETVNDLALASKGNDIHVLVSFSTTGVKHYRYNDSGALQGSSVNVDSGQSALGNVSLAINEAGTELHAAWSSKNATYPNSFNIRYAKGTINGDGSVTWGAVEQVTKNDNQVGQAIQNPSISLFGNVPLIFAETKSIRFNDTGNGVTNGTFGLIVIKRSNQLLSYPTYFDSNWTYKNLSADSSYEQKSPSSLFVPQSINGLANGRLWVGWHGKDATDSAKFNVRVSYSDDGGVTWATPVKLTSGNLYDRQNVSLAADKTGKVFALYEEHQWSPDLDIYMRTFSGGSWGAPVAVAEVDPTAESNPSALVDYSLMMTTPPFVFTNATDGIKFSGNFNVGASVSPASGALGNKETATLTAYTVTPEAGSTVTQIVEKVNGVTVNTFNNPASLSRTLTVPTATWDTLAYFATHTASITVTDSNGAQTVTTYSFDKRLATGASLLEATKANTDAKNRISQKRDLLASQVGLSAGSTFDAISAQLASGQAVVKRSTGTATTSAATIQGYNYVTIPFSSIGFVPKAIVVQRGSNLALLTHCNVDAYLFPTGTKYYSFTDNFGAVLDGTDWYINETGVRLAVGSSLSNLPVKWIAYG